MQIFFTIFNHLLILLNKIRFYLKIHLLVIKIIYDIIIIIDRFNLFMKFEIFKYLILKLLFFIYIYSLIPVTNVY